MDFESICPEVYILKLVVDELKKKIDDVTVFSKISYEFESGRVYGVEAGDDTDASIFLSCICGQTRPDKGRVYFDVDDRRIQARYTDFSIFNNKVITPDYLTGGQYMDYCMRVHDNALMDKDYYLEIMQLEKSVKDILIKNYSDFEKQAMRLIGAMINGSDVIILDEKIYNKKVLGNFIDSMRKNHIIILSARTKAMNYCDETIRLENDGESIRRIV